MILKNFQNKNYFNLHDGTSIRGSITMSNYQYSNVKNMIGREKEKATLRCNTYIRDSLSNINNRLDKKVGGSISTDMYSVGVVATTLIVDRYSIKGYKNQNYILVVEKPTIKPKRLLQGVSTKKERQQIISNYLDTI